MNINLIKQEIKTLSTLIDTWQEGKEISAIERQVALNKLTKLYELIGLDSNLSADSYAAPIAAAADVAINTPEADENEQEVEVEIIFADEDETEESEAETGTEVVAENDTAAVAATEPTPESEVEVGPVVAEDIAAEDQHATEVEPKQDTEPKQEVVKEALREEKPRLSEYQAPMMESLFGADEIQCRPRSKHQRMMAIYEEAQPKQEKVVDISKIFDMEETLPEVMVAESTPNETATLTDPAFAQEKMTLADSITPTPTLADSIAAPAALAEEMTNSKIDSLHQAIGINDKFLMIRDLFDGNNEAYDKAIAALDEQSSLEDCMIYIIENYQWNPDAEGSKFIMQLLERKFS